MFAAFCEKSLNVCNKFRRFLLTCGALSAAKVCKTCRFSENAEKWVLRLFTCKDRLRYSRERGSQSWGGVLNIHNAKCEPIYGRPALRCASSRQSASPSGVCSLEADHKPGLFISKITTRGEGGSLFSLPACLPPSNCMCLLKNTYFDR